MSNIEWSPWIKHAGDECPEVIANIETSVMLADGNTDYYGFVFGKEWHWGQGEGPGEITHYRIPMSDYKRITGMPEWSHLPAWAKWIAQCSYGEWECFSEKPVASRFWQHKPGLGEHLSNCKGTVLGDWRDTLQERPAESTATKDLGYAAKAFGLSSSMTKEKIDMAAEKLARTIRDQLDSHPNSEPDADQYSVGADTFPQDARDELLKRAKEQNLNPYDAPGFLEAALGHMEDRKTTYDAPEGERSMGKTVAAFNAITGRDLSEEEGWLFMVLLKAVRTQQGAFRADNYEDGAAYFALQGEAAARDRGHE